MNLFKGDRIKVVTYTSDEGFNIPEENKALIVGQKGVLVEDDDPEFFVVELDESVLGQTKWVFRPGEIEWV